MATIFGLQRGRALVSAEIAHLAVGELRGALASTGPRFGKRGDGIYAASRDYRDALLQRGRALVSAEMPSATTAGPSVPWLQRGRALVSAEMPRPRWTPRKRHSFNGAALW